MKHANQKRNKPYENDPFDNDFIFNPDSERIKDSIISINTQNNQCSYLWI